MIIIIYLIFAYSSFQIKLKQCSVYPVNRINCLEQTKDFQCAFDQKVNSCVPIVETNLGCDSNLNEKACMSQLFNKQGQKCVFDQKCSNVSQNKLSRIGCFEKLSKYACLNISDHKCRWDSKCEKIDTEQIEGLSCEEQFKMPVTSLACSTLINLECLNTGIKGDYQCLGVQQANYSTLRCSQLGLTELACLKIQTIGEKCIYKNKICQPFSNDQFVSCNLKLNREACLSIENYSLGCQWSKQICQEFLYTSQPKEIIPDVTQNVCRNLVGPYKYVQEKFQCERIQLENNYDIPCNTLGLSKEGCLKIKIENCIFYDGKCQKLNEQDLKIYSCNMDLNELACVNLTTELQYCKWNGSKCERVFMNQDLDCPFRFDDQPIKVNGNVCQAISKPNVLCKYDQKTNFCINSTPDDDCHTPYINQKGCVSINNVKNKKACKWTNDQCISVEIIAYFTTCDSLQHANPYACSQVFENNSVGCYYDKVQQKCVTLKIDDQMDNNTKLLLETISCSDPLLGLNRVMCTSIKTKQTPCRWYKEQCIFVKEEEIRQIPCDSLEFANDQVCAFVQYENQKCSYNENKKKCVDYIKDMTNCNQPGLNRKACATIKNNCYFLNNVCQSKQILTTNLQCNSNSLSEQLCKEITTEGQYCRWDERYNKCINIEVLPNIPCNEFKNVNINVCSLVKMSSPDYDPRNPNGTSNQGICWYNVKEAQCETLGPNLDSTIDLNYCQIKNFQTTKCCTDAVGINAHACSRYSSKDPKVICYFSNDRCQELTNNEVDINDPEQVKFFFNEKRLPCSHLPKNFCHMSDWSGSQRCIYDGKICNEFDPQLYPNLSIVIQEGITTNKSLCLSLQANLSNIVKYFTYDEVNKRCQILSQTSFQSCEDVNGNRNACLRFTENYYCKWDTNNLKCITIYEDELYDMKSCDQNTNIKTCNNNKYQACYFNYDSDVCMKAPTNIRCGDLQNINEIVCKSSTKEPCEYSQDIENQDKKKCYILTKIFNGCTSDLIVNSKACYNNFQGDCRWNQETLTCYQNQDEISTLGCQDNLSKELCLKVTKEACFWNQSNIQCERFQQVTHLQFQSYNSENLYNLKACLLINSEGYHHDQSKNKCVWIRNENHLKCSDFKMNKYACLLLTRGSKCYYKDGECFDFVNDQTICDAGIDINIEVCMDVPNKCHFDSDSLKCENAIMEEFTTCQQLFLSQFDKPEDSYPDGMQKMNENKREKRSYNKLSCSSINQNNFQEYGEAQCYQTDQKFQQCNYQNKCMWDNNTYTCNVFAALESIFIEWHYHEIQKMMYVFNETLQLEIIDDQNPNCSTQSTTDGTIINQTVESRCLYSNEICSKNADCPSFYNYTFSQEKYNSSEDFQNFIKNQKTYDDQCIKYCSPVNTSCDKVINFQFGNEKKKKVCSNIKFYQKQPLCYTIQNIIPKCDNIYSKEVCLQHVQEKCYFDLNQGGCKQFKGNEHKLPSCSAIQRECYGSYSQKAICKTIDATQPKDCLTLPQNKYCTIMSISKTQQKCDEISKQDVQPILCAQALDKCRFDGTQCVSTLQYPCNCDSNCSQELCKICNCNLWNNQFSNDNNKNHCDCHENSSQEQCQKCGCKFEGTKCVRTFKDPCKCDRSYSKELCEICGCNFDYLGYCQTDKQPPALDGKNQYYLCQEANLLGDQNIQEICGSVAQACRFRQNKCEDATHLKCEDLINYTVSKIACLRCKDKPMKYIMDKKKCEQLKEVEKFDQCENLNYLACIRNTTKQCYWIDQNCKEEASQQPECSLRNYYGCIKATTEQQNLCWFNADSKLCEKYSPSKGKCVLYKNKSTCMLSMVESCTWNGQTCESELNSNSSNCDGLNKYGCLNIQSIPCVWSDILLKCQSAQFSSDQVNCTQFLENHMNAQTCTQIQSDKSCIFGKNYKCREILEPQFYDCEAQGLNLNACLSKTKNSCAFINNRCISFTNTNEGCKNNLNQKACLNQVNKCQYGLKKCETLSEDSQYSSEQGLQFQREQKLKYPSSYCKKQDFIQNISRSLIYIQELGICIDITDRDANVPNCGSDGINRYACLSKTLGSCQYVNSNCKEIKNEQITSCGDALNWVACLSIKKLNCKFMDFKCQPISEGDSCKSLTGAIVNPITCATTNDVPCKYDSKIKGCIEVTIKNEMCSTLGLNEKACVFNTTNSKCKFSLKECKMDFEIAKCTDKLNKNACLGLKDQYCYFHENDGCKEIDTSIINPLKCASKPDVQVTAITCSLAIDYPCLYDQTNKICKIIKTVDDLNFELENPISINKLACLQIQSINTYWQGRCQKATDEILTQLQCDDQLNKWSCLNLKAQSQLCQYRDNKCETYQQRDEVTCEMITNINNGIICSLYTGKPCQYDSNQFYCKEVLKDNPTNQNCSERGKLFYNKEACEFNEECIFIDKKCQKKIQNNLYYCSQGQQIENCKNVLLEGCYRNSQQKCQVITSQLQKSLNCSDIENQVGCKQLQTKGQYCRYYDNKCQNENIKDYKLKNCKDIKIINNYEFCEQTQDIECTYDPLNNSCIESKQEEQDLTCPRGLNKLACIPLNSNSNQCQFFNYCYGLNSDILNCNIDDNQCCSKAQTIQSCLFQTKFKCQWNNDKCIYYDDNNQQINQKLECNRIQNASRNICYSLLNNFCIFDHLNYKCMQIIPLTCDSVQSAQQCKRIPNIPCYWNQDQCQLKQQDLSDTCQYITQMSGNYQACIQIQRSGQMCIFDNYQCLSFQEIQNTDNCLHNINQNACLQQTISLCYWDLDVQSSEYNYIGICKRFDEQQQIKFDCQSNLSFKSCLAVVKLNSYCQWKNGTCQKILDEDLTIEKLSTLLYVNKQTCSVFASAKFIYDEIMFKCINNKTQSKICTWNVEKQECINPISKSFRKNAAEVNLKYSAASTSQRSTMAEDGPCGIIDEVCAQVNVKVAECDHQGLNKYACLNIKTQPCIWITNTNDNVEHCELRIPEGNCEEQNYYLGVNALLCSMVQEYDPCAYDSQNQKCQKPDENLTNCNVEGINVYGCVQMKNCYFQNQTCKLFDPKINLSCQDAQYANELVCPQIKNGGCKRNLIDIGCIQSSILDTCTTEGININGCNSIEQCQWENEKCLHKIYLEKSKDCSENLDEQSCNNSGKCYFEQSIFNDDKNICKEKHCNRMSKCNYELYKGKICYQHFNGKCMEATSCEEIKSAFVDCSQFQFNNLQCVSDGNRGCMQFQNCENLDRKQCLKYRQCALSTSCVTKLCHHIQDQYECINYDCTWNYKQCVNQIKCSEIDQEKDCNKNQYQGQQCSWTKVKTENSEREFCSSDGCSYLPQNVECHGTQVGFAVCLLTKDLFCLSCEQIVEIHDCLEKVEFCSYDTEKNKCISQSCENFNQQNCQNNRCFFSEKYQVEYNNYYQICIPQCQFQYSKAQCQQLELCTWDDGLTPPCVQIQHSTDPNNNNNNNNNNVLLFEISGTLLIPLIIQLFL